MILLTRQYIPSFLALSRSLLCSISILVRKWQLTAYWKKVSLAFWQVKVGIVTSVLRLNGLWNVTLCSCCCCFFFLHFLPPTVPDDKELWNYNSILHKQAITNFYASVSLDTRGVLESYPSSTPTRTSSASHGTCAWNTEKNQIENFHYATN